MKKYVIFLLLSLLTAAGPVHAQNNAYGLDDNAYSWFLRTESALGTDEFFVCADSLLQAALRANDTKAETIYHLEQLKNYTRQMRGKPLTEESDRLVENLLEEVQEIAVKYDYPQYYYYAYELESTHYFNHGRRTRTWEIIRKMQDEAVASGNHYGIWSSTRFMVNIYIQQGDYISAKQHILEALDIHNITDDPTVKRQSVCRLYCDLADAYPITSDSLRINIDKAEAERKMPLDSVRVSYYRAVLAGLDRDRHAFESAVAFCERSPQLSTISPTAKLLFEIIEQIMDGKNLNAIPSEVDSLYRWREAKYVANIAESYGYEDVAFHVEKELVQRIEALLYRTNEESISEMSARLGNIKLSNNLAAREKDVIRITRLAVILTLLILLGIMAVLINHIFALRRNREKDERQIEELRLANERVVAANAAKTRFVQNMSHEIRTPLNAIVGFSQLLSLPDGSFSEEEKDEFSGHIINNTKMLTMLLDDILNASAMDSGEYRITIEEGECHFMCKAAISSAEHRLQPGVQLLYEPEFTDPFYFRTDPQRVQQILINLITNSCKHTPSGWIKVSSSLTAVPGYVQFSVTDTGSGVPPEAAERIFERFTKLDEFVQGTGLGLSICRDIADRMGSRIYLDTTYTAGGARFCFEVPVTPPEPSKPTE